ncbi:MAG: ABC transporter ATP-binding protein [Candidatus Thorarchaeota archaeon]
MDTNVVIEVNNLSKHFQLRKSTKINKFFPKGPKSSKRKGTNGSVIRAVENISFEVEKGEIFGLLGPNGAGKTTTIRMLTGVLEPTLGSITIFGRNFLREKIMIQQIIGNVPEMANAYLDLTGIQNLELIGELYGIKKDIRNQRAEDLLRKFELFAKRNLKAKRYSKGMKQRLLLCMALISEPKILFLDEPTSGLDVQSSIIIKNLIKDYNKTGMTILLTTHNMDVANELCDRIAIINKGRLVELNTPQDLRMLKQEYQAFDVHFKKKDISFDELESLPNIKEICRIEDYYRIIVSNLNSGLCDIVEYARSHNMQITKINTYEPHLQDVFLRIINERGL